MLRDRLKQLLFSCCTFRFIKYSTSNAMSPAWSPLTLPAATEQGTGQLLQSTAAVNIIFVNIDWKRSRHENEKCTKKIASASQHYIFHSHSHEASRHLLL